MLNDLKVFGFSFLIVFSFTLIGLSGCATAPHVEKHSLPNDFRQTIPLTNIAGKWVLPIVVNDIELNLMLDTGSTQVALFENIRTKNFFDNADSFTKTRAFNRSGPPVRSKLMKNATLRMDGFPEQNVRATLFENDQNPYFMYKIDGIIGFDLLNIYDIRIDNREMLATFTKGGALMRSTDERYLPIKLIGKIPTFEGRLRFPYADDGEILSVTIDTGTNATILVFTPENVNANTDTTTVKEVYGQSISGLEKYTKIPDVSITATNGNFFFKAEASVKTIENIKTRASIGMPALSGDIVEISYTSKFISVSDEVDPPS